MASAYEGRSLVAGDLTALTGGAGPQRASGFSLRHFAGEWWLCRSVDGRWTNTGYAARAGRWWRWANGTLVETRIPAPWPSRRGRYGLTASAAGSTSETALGVVQPDPGKYGRRTGATVPATRVLDRVLRANQGGQGPGEGLDG